MGCVRRACLRGLCRLRRRRRLWLHACAPALSRSGLRGRKRDVTEGGTRGIGLVEAPFVVAAPGRGEPSYPISTMDTLPTLLDLLGLPPSSVLPQGRALDGTSLLPVLRGDVSERDAAAAIGIHGSFRFGSSSTCRRTTSCFYGDGSRTCTCNLDCS